MVLSVHQPNKCKRDHRDRGNKWACVEKRSDKHSLIDLPEEKRRTGLRYTADSFDSSKIHDLEDLRSLGGKINSTKE